MLTSTQTIAQNASWCKNGKVGTKNPTEIAQSRGASKLGDAGYSGRAIPLWILGSAFVHTIAIFCTRVSNSTAQQFQAETVDPLGSLAGRVETSPPSSGTGPYLRLPKRSPRAIYTTKI
ncbi:hypothetical protein J6590_017006 [Homalodisca vitripennis]|nr:hypothetical protein J6590_017006 [Homalodisca vitripennis]